MAKGTTRKEGRKQVGVIGPASIVSRKAVEKGVSLPAYIRFTVGFTLSCIALCSAILILPAALTQPINENVARALGLVLSGLGVPNVSTVNGVVSDGKLPLKIISECTPLFMTALCVCFTAFYPATLRQKAAGLIAGIPALYLGNLARLTVIFMVCRHDPQLFKVVHVYWGQIFSVLLVLMTCALWLEWMDKDGAKKGAGLTIMSFLARFALISGCIFLVWLKLQHGYIRLLDRLMLFGFSLFGAHFHSELKAAVYYETFSVVAFTSLVLAVRSTPWRSRVKHLAAGLGFLFLTHLFHRVDNYLVVLFHYTALAPIDLVLLVMGQYLLPVLVLIYSIRRRGRQILPGQRKVKAKDIAPAGP